MLYYMKMHCSIFKAYHYRRRGIKEKKEREKKVSYLMYIRQSAKSDRKREIGRRERERERERGREQ